MADIDTIRERLDAVEIDKIYGIAKDEEVCFMCGNNSEPFDDVNLSKPLCESCYNEAVVVRVEDALRMAKTTNNETLVLLLTKILNF